MIRRTPLLAVPLLLALAACAQAGPADPPDPSGHRWVAFDQRAAEVAQAWRAGLADRPAWRSGYVPLQGPTVLPADPGFTTETRQAFQAGWYRAAADLPTERPAKGTIRFPDGTLTVPMLSAAQAYQQLDQGDPPPCPGRPATPPPAAPTGPDSSVSSGVAPACLFLTVTGAELGSVTVRTSRGEAEVPAWLFTVEELAAPVARLAVAPAAVGPVPSGSAPAVMPAPELVGAVDLTRIDGATLHYRLGVGACDRDITPLVWQDADVVVLGGGVTRTTGPCTEQLLLAPVTVTLDEPLAARPALDAATGQPLLLVPLP